MTMKKVLLVAALTMMSAGAYASKARDAALGAAAALPAVTGTQNAVDYNMGGVTLPDSVQRVFTNPAKMHNVGDLLTIEYANATGTEGGIFRSDGDSKWGVYFGHKSAVLAALQASLANSLTEQNPFEVFYGQKGDGMNWGASFLYSAAENKNAGTGAVGNKVSSMGLRVGATTDMWEAYVQAGISGSTELGNGDKATADMALRVGGQYNMDDMTVFADVQTGGGKVTVANNDTKVTNQLMSVGVESKVKGEGSHFFYGVKYVNFTAKVGDNGQATASRLPIYAGVEAEVASWLVARASISQSLLLNSTKMTDTTNTVQTDVTGMNDNTVGLGMGLKLGKAMVDGTLAAAGNGGTLSLGDANFMGMASLTYNF